MNHMVSYFIQCCFRRQRPFRLPLLPFFSLNLPFRQFQKVSALIPTKVVFFKSGTSRLPYITWPLIDTKEKVTGRSIVSNPVKQLSPPRVGEQNSGSEIDRNCGGRGHGINHEMKLTALQTNIISQFVLLDTYPHWVLSFLGNRFYEIIIPSEVIEFTQEHRFVQSHPSLKRVKLLDGKIAVSHLLH